MQRAAECDVELYQARRNQSEQKRAIAQKPRIWHWSEARRETCCYSGGEKGRYRVGTDEVYLIVHFVSNIMLPIINLL
jgi:hypothetical protein